MKVAWRGVGALALGMIAAWVHGNPSATSASRSECVPVFAGLDTSMRTGSVPGDLGAAQGQTFVALDTVVTQITVWRPKGNRSVIGADLFVTRVDSSFSPPRPNTRAILLVGPTIHQYDSEPPGQYIPMRFPIDPPLVLPGAGQYAFLVRPEGCFFGAAWYIITSVHNPYPDGLQWVTGRVSQPPCYLRPVVGGSDSTDIIFEIEYCRDVMTPTKRRTWGELKILYR